MDDDPPGKATAVVSRRVFWSGITSPAHVVYGAAWLRQFADDGLTVVVWPPRSFLGRESVTLDHVRAALPDGVQVLPLATAGLRGRPDELLAYLSVGVPGIKPWFRLHAANPWRRIPVVVTDEGLGSLGTLANRVQSFDRESSHLTGAGWVVARLRSRVRALAHAAASRWLVNTRWSLYRPDGNGGWHFNEQLAEQLRQAVPTTHRAGDEPNRAVFCAQPWVELGQIGLADYRTWLRAMADIVEADGYQFAVRPHPAEDVSHYEGFEVLPVSGPAETDPNCTSAALLLGISSSSLLNLAAIHQIPAIRVLPDQLGGLERTMGPRQASVLRYFLHEPATLDTLAERLPVRRSTPKEA